MFFRLLYDEFLAQASYVVACERSREALVVDPTRDVERYEELAVRHGLRISAIVETHIHADFLSGSRELASLSGATVYLSDAGTPEWRYAWASEGAVLLHNGDAFRVGELLVTVLHTPGHTPEHLCFSITDRGHSATYPVGIFTGDFLFVGDVGRPDLLESAVGEQGKARESAYQLYESLQILETFPDFVQVWPGHGAGSACGKALGAILQSTVGYERRYNPALQLLSDRERFVGFVLEGQPDPPLYFARMKHLNRQGPPLLGVLPQPRRLTLSELREAGDVWVIDTRPWELFCRGHWEGALCAPLTQAFPVVVASYVPEGAPVVLVIEHRALADAVRQLVRVGVDSVIGYVEPAELERTGALVELPTLGIEELMELKQREGVLLLDVRSSSEYSAGHIPGALNAPYGRLPSVSSQLAREDELVVYCQTGERSTYAAAFLQREGFRVRLYRGGFSEWSRARDEVRHLR